MAGIIGDDNGSFGAIFEGFQHLTLATASSRPAERWRIQIEIRQVDLKAGTISGQIVAFEIPSQMFHEPLPDDEVGPLVTAFVGNIVDGRNHHFTTLSEEALSSHSSVFFRIKETDFIIKPPNREFTISGMYYCAIDRTTCQLHGLYCDPLAIPLQRVEAVLMTPTMKHRMEADKAIEKEGDNDSDDENDDEADAIEATIPIKQARPSFAFSSLR